MKKTHLFISTSYSLTSHIPFLMSDADNFVVYARPVIDAPKEVNFLDMVLKEGDYDSFVKKLISSDLYKKILSLEGEVYVNSFKTRKELQPIYDIPNVNILGFSVEEDELLNDKIFQLNLLKDKVPIPKFIVDSPEKLIENYDNIKSPNGVFTSKQYGNGGHGTRVHKNKKLLENYLKDVDDNIIMQEALDIHTSATADMIVANPDEIIVYGLSDMLVNETRSEGNSYPSSLPEKIKIDIYEISRVIGKEIANLGLRGYVNLDFNYTVDGNVYFGEINARYGATSNEKMLLIESTRGNNPSIIDLELMAVRDGTFHGHGKIAEPNLFWFKKDLYPTKEGVVHYHLPFFDEMNAFKNGFGLGVVGQFPIDYPMKKDQSFGKYVSVAKDGDSLFNKEFSFVVRS